MKKYNRVTPEGTKDFLFEECLTRSHVEKEITDVFLNHGFHEVVTPGLEYFDVFDPDFSGIGQEVMYKMSDRRGRLIVMRPDSTLPIARLTATRLQNLPKPIRLFYTQPIYRNNPGLTGRSDETVQTGIELLGADGIRADLEVLSTAVEALSACTPDFRFELGHAGFFRALSQLLPVSADMREDIRTAVETKNYAALDAILDTLDDTPQVRAVRALPRLFGGEEVFEKAAPYCDGNMRKTLDYLHSIYRSLAEFGLGSRLIVDLGLVQRNDYYTGMVFSAYAEHCGDAILLGGRYDNLLEHFGNSMSAVGFGVNVDAIAGLLLEHGKGRGVRRADVLVHGKDGFEVKALQHSAWLSRQGLQCENSVFATEEEALAYAKKCGIERVDIVGDGICTISPLQEKV